LHPQMCSEMKCMTIECKLDGLFFTHRISIAIASSPSLCPGCCFPPNHMAICARKRWLPSEACLPCGQLAHFRSLYHCLLAVPKQASKQAEVWRLLMFELLSGWAPCIPKLAASHALLLSVAFGAHHGCVACQSGHLHHASRVCWRGLLTVALCAHYGLPIIV
jgi:hypothetical protein